MNQVSLRIRFQLGLMHRKWLRLKLNLLKVWLSHRFLVENRCHHRVEVQCRLLVGVHSRMVMLRKVMDMLRHIRVGLLSLTAMLHRRQEGIQERLQVMVNNNQLQVKLGSLISLLLHPRLRH